MCTKTFQPISLAMHNTNNIHCISVSLHTGAQARDRDESSCGLMCVGAIGASAVAGFFLAPVVVPAALGAAGFTSAGIAAAGIAAGSVAASAMRQQQQQQQQ